MDRLDEILAGGHSGPTRLTLDELQTIARRCILENKVLVRIEAFELTPDRDLDRWEYSYRERHEMQEGKWADRALAASAFVDRLGDDIRGETREIHFEVWVATQRP